MLQDQALWIVLAKLTRQESELELAQPFLFGLSDILYQVEPYMKTIVYECPFIVHDQGGIVSLQDGLISYLSHNNPV
jgi:hypothetical protein